MKSLRVCTVIMLIYTGIFASYPAQAEGPLRLKGLPVRERLTYRISWNGIPVGTVSTLVEEITEVHNRTAYKAVLHATTNRWASLFYRVDDKFVTYIDYETSNSLRHEVIRSEGRYRKRAVIEYIYGKFLAEYCCLKSGKKKTVDIEPNIQDPLSAAYYFLRINYKEGDRIALNIDLNEKSYKLSAEVERGRDISIPGVGKFQTLVIRPYVERKGKPYKRGNGWAYVSLDEKRIPLYAVIRVSIWGRFTAKLLPT